MILPTKIISLEMKRTLKYGRIAASVRELGVIEPLVVYPQASTGGQQYLLLDGHVRLDLLHELGVEETDCLVATDDEAFTYNHKINRLSPMQEHFMIMKAVKSGIAEERIAKTLNVDVASIRRKVDMLDGVCAEAVDLLKNQRVTPGALRELKRVKPMRQIEIAELMIASHNYSVDYAKCLYAATPDDQVLDAERPKDVDGLGVEEMARMEKEMEKLSRDFRRIEETHGHNVLNLVLVAGYLKRLLDNARVVRYLSQHYAEILAEFQRIAEARNLKSDV